jgi:hypothetical protein
MKYEKLASENGSGEEREGLKALRVASLGEAMGDGSSMTLGEKDKRQ